MTSLALRSRRVLQIAARLNTKASNATAYFLAEVHTALAALDSTVGQTVSPFPSTMSLSAISPWASTFKHLRQDCEKALLRAALASRLIILSACGHVVQINALKKQNIYEKSVIILTSKHGNSPIDPSTLVRVPPAVRQPSTNKA